VGTNLFWFINEYQNGPGDQSAFSGGSMDSRFCPVKINGIYGGNDGLASFALGDFDTLKTGKNDANYPE